MTSEPSPDLQALAHELEEVDAEALAKACEALLRLLISRYESMAAVESQAA